MIDRRQVLRVLHTFPMIAMGGAGKTQRLNHEDELRKILYASPHLFHIVGHDVCVPGTDHSFYEVWLDGKRCAYTQEVMCSPRPKTPVRGAVLLCIDADGRPAREVKDVWVLGDSVVCEWRIGEVWWDFASHG